MSVKIIAIRKDNGNHENPHVAISHLKWVNEKTGESGLTTRVDMHSWLTRGGIAFTKDIYGNMAYLYPAISRFNNPFVITIADGKETDNLLKLPEA